MAVGKVGTRDAEAAPRPLRAKVLECQEEDAAPRDSLIVLGDLLQLKVVMKRRTPMSSAPLLLSGSETSG